MAVWDSLTYQMPLTRPQAVSLFVRPQSWLSSSGFFSLMVGFSSFPPVPGKYFTIWSACVESPNPMQSVDTPPNLHADSYILNAYARQAGTWLWGGLPMTL